MYRVDFDIAAILLCLVTLYLYYMQKRVGSAQSRLFAILIWVALGSAATSVASDIAIAGLPATPLSVLYILTTIYYLFHNSLPLIVAAYIWSFAGMAWDGRWKKILFFLPWAVSIACVLSNPLTRFVFYVDSGSSYRHGAGLILLYSIAFVYLVAAYGSLRLSKDSKARTYHRAYLLAILFPVGAIIIQHSTPGLSLEPFAVATSLLFSLLAIQDARDLTDSQTGFYNRTALIQFLQQYLDQREPFTVLIVHSPELTALQSLTDMETYEVILQSVCSWYRYNASKRTLIFLLDAGLFVLLEKEADPAERSESMAVKIIERSQGVWAFGLSQIRLPVQLAILRCPGDLRSVPDLLDCIDQIRRPPLSISNRHIFNRHDFDMGGHDREARIALGLKDLVGKNKTSLRYQPVWSISERRVTAVEALMDLPIDARERVYQSEVFRVAEKLGLSRPLASLILDTACAWYEGKNLAALGIAQMQVRLPPSVYMAQDWPELILKSAEAHHLGLRSLCLELTETSVVEARDLEKGMAALAGLGLTFALDDFGSGYTDLGADMALPFSIVKLDKRIIRAAGSDAKGRHLLEGSISLFSHLGRKIVAEGVETEEQSEFLALMGCDYLQGYHVGYPQDGEELLTLLSEPEKK
jgi:EAL domain-containing protein (putative c-di-GMP-specific phosphodiesterase class I)/GGDEF domain-containing protein